MTQIRNMRELRLVRQNLRYKVVHLEEKLKDQSIESLYSMTGVLRDFAFEAGMRIVLGLFDRRRRRKRKKKERQEHEARES